MRQPYLSISKCFAVAAIMLAVIATASSARAEAAIALIHRVNPALRSNDRLNGAKVYVDNVRARSKG